MQECRSAVAFIHEFTVLLFVMSALALCMTSTGGKSSYLPALCFSLFSTLGIFFHQSFLPLLFDLLFTNSIFPTHFTAKIN